MNLRGAVHPLQTPLPMLMSNRKALEVILLDLLNSFSTCQKHNHFFAIFMTLDAFTNLYALFSPPLFVHGTPSTEGIAWVGAEC
jgi:hypothetical protein